MTSNLSQLATILNLHKVTYGQDVSHLLYVVQGRKVPPSMFMHILEAVSVATNVPIGVAFGKNRNREKIDAMHLYIYAAKKHVKGITQEKLAEYLGVTRSNVCSSLRASDKLIKTDKRFIEAANKVFDIVNAI